MIVLATIFTTTVAVLLVGAAGKHFLSASVEPRAAASVARYLDGSNVTAKTASHDDRRAVTNVRFFDGDGQSRSLSDFQGKLVLLNIWATWCLPCRREMPTLDRLQKALGGPDFEVVALSIDRAGLEVVREFYEEIGINDLAIYIDDSGKSAGQLAVIGLPATLLIDPAGMETDRHIGPAEWDTAAMKSFLRNRLAGKPGALASAIFEDGAPQ